MHKKYFRSCISLLLIFTMVVCGTVTAAAYSPVVVIESNEWTVSNSAVTKYEYPNFSAGGGREEGFYDHEELFGDTCYISIDGEDIDWMNEVDVKFNSSEFKYDGFYIFCHNVYVYILNFSPDEFRIMLDDVGHLYFKSLSDKLTHLYVYTMSYPFTSIVLSLDITFGVSEDCRYDALSTVQYFEARSLQPEYSTVDVLSYTPNSNASGGIVYKADAAIKGNFSNTYTLEKSLKIYGGLMGFSLTRKQVEALSLGKYCFSFDNTGYIPLHESSLAYFTFALGVVDDNGDIINLSTLLQEVSYDNAFSNIVITPAYTPFIEDYLVFWDNNLITDSNEDTFYCMLFFEFACDTMAAFFPGTLEIIEYESYEDDMEQEEVIDAVDNAAGKIVGEISSASSNLSSEIKDAASGIKDTINSSTAEIVTSVDSATSELSDRLQDVADSVDDASDKLSDKLGEVKDGITNKLTEVKDNLLDGIKSFFIPADEVMEEIDNKWDELLKSRFGALYEVSGIITDFASNMSWDYVKQAGEKKTITMPSVTVEFSGTPFTFGGYEVKVVPEGFDVLTTALKGITSIVCTLMFVNALRKKYDKLVGGNAV